MSRNLKTLNFSRDPLLKHSLFLLTILLANELLNWPLLRLWNVSAGTGNFIDLRTLIYYSDCFKEVGNKIYDPLTEYCGGYLYGMSLIQFLKLVPIPIWMVNLFGICLLLCYVMLVTIMVLQPIQKLDCSIFWFYLISLSPPMMLWVQRGQIDIVVAVLTLMLKPLVFSKKYTSTGGYLTILGLGFMSLVKWYPSILLILVILLPTRQAFKYVAGAIFIFVLAVFSFELKYFPIKPGSMPSDPNNTFGLRNVTATINGTSSFELTETMELVLVLTITFIFLLVYRFSVWHQSLRLLRKRANQETSMLSLIFAFNLLFITSFFLGPSIDFRLFFGCCSLLLISLYNNEQQNAGNYVSMATLMLWLSYESGGLEVFGDLISHFIALYLCIFCVAMSGKILYRFGESSKSTIKK